MGVESSSNLDVTLTKDDLREQYRHGQQSQHPQQQQSSSQMLSAEHEEDDGPIYDSMNSFAACFCCNPFENFLPDFVGLQGQSFDFFLVHSASTCRVARSDISLSFDHPATPFPPTLTASDETCEALLEIDHEELGKVYFCVVHDPVQSRNRLEGQLSPECGCMNERRNSFQAQTGAEVEKGEKEEETLQLLATLLKPGKNEVRYLFRNQYRVLGFAHASVFLWDVNDKVAVCDVDGTITTSNVRGIYDTIVTENYGYCHDRVCRFMTTLKRGGREHHKDENPQEEQEQQSVRNINILYLTSRPLFLAQATRKFLLGLRQSGAKSIDGAEGTEGSSSTRDETKLIEARRHQLPEGPLIGFGGRFLDVMKMELVSFTVHLFKAKVLMDQIVSPFCHVSEDAHATHRSLFVAGFGNTMMDVQAYHMAGIKLEQIYLIDKKSRIICLDKVDGDNNEGESSRTKRVKSSFLRRLSSMGDDGGDGAVAGSSVDQTSRSSFFKRRSSASVSLGQDEGTGESNKFLLVDDAQPAEKTDQRPSLKTPFPKRMYKQKLGTIFHGYDDPQLVPHVLGVK